MEELEGVTADGFALSTVVPGEEEEAVDEVVSEWFLVQGALLEDVSESEAEVDSVLVPEGVVVVPYDRVEDSLMELVGTEEEEGKPLETPVPTLEEV